VSGLYLVAILAACGFMCLIDFRYKLAFWYDAKRTLVSVIVPVVLFVVWDIICISLGIFHIGDSTMFLGVSLAPEFPLEELFFLAFLCYFTLIVYRVMERLCTRI
jgi:lycopene cyclase domain-containing protein